VEQGRLGWQRQTTKNPTKPGFLLLLARVLLQTDVAAIVLGDDDRSVEPECH
jgi:hypothetical protein